MMLYEEDDKFEPLKFIKGVFKFVNIEIQKAFYHSMGRLFNNKKWMNKYKPREIPKEELLEYIKTFKKYYKYYYED